MEKLQKNIIKLILNSPFYGSLIMQMKKKCDNNFPSYMGVGIKDGRINLFYNQKMLEELPDSHIQGILIHECMHVVMRHFCRKQERNIIVNSPMGPIQLWNIATDMAINQMINPEMLPVCVVSYKNFGFEKGLSSESYYDLLMKKIKNDPNFGIGDGDSIDNHDMWSEEGANTNLEDAIVKNAIKKAHNHAKKQGKCPSDIIEHIENWLKPPIIPWPRILKQYIGTCLRVNHEYTWKRLSRRFDEEQKGKKALKKLKMIVAIDTSGSISKEEFNLFINEIVGISKSHLTDITILECDAEIQKEYKLRNSKVDVDFKGRGGTDFRPVFEHAVKNKSKPALLIYLTDLMGTFPKEKPSFPVIWVALPGYKMDVPFGKVLNLEKI